MGMGLISNALDLIVIRHFTASDTSPTTAKLTQLPTQRDVAGPGLHVSADSGAVGIAN
jgi:hypothetical protein